MNNQYQSFQNLYNQVNVTGFTVNSPDGKIFCPTLEANTIILSGGTVGLGATWAQGETGMMGTPGGETGTQGPTGADGLTGLQGQTGNVGITGM